jgi:hypothetical protein
LYLHTRILFLKILSYIFFDTQQEPPTSQACGFSPVWILSCFTFSWGLVNLRPQCWHW